MISQLLMVSLVPFSHTPAKTPTGVVVRDSKQCYGWLDADIRPYPFFTKRVTNLSSAPLPLPDILVFLAMVKFHNETYWAKSTFCRIETKSMSMYTRLSVPKRFAKVGWQTRKFSQKENEKSGCQTRLRQTI